MKKHILKVVAFIVLAAPASLVYAQSYVPVSPKVERSSEKSEMSDLNLVTERLGLNSIMATTGYASASSDREAHGLPECVPAPTVKGLSGNMEFHKSVISSSAAMKLGIPVADVSLTGNQMVMVQDYSRTKSCLANDGKTVLVYGQTIRMIITIESFKSESTMSLAAIAATATIGGDRNAVKIQVLGLDNPKITLKVAELSGKELNVESYAAFAQLPGELMKIVADPNTKQSVQRLGIVAEDQPKDLAANVSAAFALQQLKDGSSCEDAKKGYKKPSVSILRAIAEVYGSVQGACSQSVPTPLQRAAASEYLNGLQVKYPVW